ncbi:uncharacterized protein LOC130621349 [Hydractinia symbiolongicarpus]|uniref:uncharacterized protein LOC130621349 n=1 Tax=Hydractinia symbiolongicarpus TaxID=13093 RepID=UPI0025500292|nr:uncharacterized protein LOC130621349 [Hydractinia symbiolongicarpus]
MGQPMFFVLAFRSDIQTCGKLSPQSIEILSKPSSVRTDQEVKLIQKIVYRLKCFDRYPLFVKQELARVIYYDKFEDGRLIIKQGHPGSSFYFIVSGAVIVERIEFDPFINEHYTQVIGELQAGDSFGELALLHNTKRAASILCRGTSEFLRVDKPDFDEVLHTSHQREWEIRVNLLSSHPVFQGWTTRELKLVNGHSKMKNYPPNSVRRECYLIFVNRRVFIKILFWLLFSLLIPVFVLHVSKFFVTRCEGVCLHFNVLFQVIVSEKKLRNDRVFFIASGHCSVVRRIDLLKKFVSKKKYKYTLPPLKTGNETNSVDTFKRLSSYSNEYMPCNNDVQLVTKRRCSKQADVLETRYFMVRELSDGDFFNVGESLEGLYVISVGRVGLHYCYNTANGKGSFTLFFQSNGIAGLSVYCC